MSLKPKPRCKVKGCTNPQKTKGLCGMHDSRARRDDGNPGEATSRHGNPTVQVGFRAKPALAAELKASAKRQKVTVSQLCARLLTSVMGTGA